MLADNPSDVGITRYSLESIPVANELGVIEDGQEALDYLWAAAPVPDGMSPACLRWFSWISDFPKYLAWR